MSGQNLKAYICMSLLSPSAQWRIWERVLEHNSRKPGFNFTFTFTFTRFLSFSKHRNKKDPQEQTCLIDGDAFRCGRRDPRLT